MALAEYNLIICWFLCANTQVPHRGSHKPKGQRQKTSVRRRGTRNRCWWKTPKDIGHRRGFRITRGYNSRENVQNLKGSLDGLRRERTTDAQKWLSRSLRVGRHMERIRHATTACAWEARAMQVDGKAMDRLVPQVLQGASGTERNVASPCCGEHNSASRSKLTTGKEGDGASGH